MHFKYLTPIGDGYAFEEGTSGHRVHLLVWRGIETKLKQAILDLKNLLKTPTSAPPNLSGGRSVSELVKFHEAEQNKYAPQAAVQEARKKVDLHKRWLALEGAAADEHGNIDMSKLKPLVVEYDRNPQLQGMTLVKFIGGRLFTDQGRTPLSTKDMVTHFSGPGKAIYVMSITGNLHVASHVVGHFHHSSLLAGQNVACAGELEAVGGTLMWLSNKSGHYRPKVEHLLQVLHQIQNKNVSMTFRLTVCSAGPQRNYNTVGDFLKDLDLNEEPDYELMKLMAYSRHLTDDVLGQNGWRWRRALTENPGVYEMATARPVAHKAVRQWLKGLGLHADVDMQSGVGR